MNTTVVQRAINPLTEDQIEEEFSRATLGMDFEGQELLRNTFFTYFKAGAMWAQDTLLPGIVTPDEEFTTGIILKS